MTRLTTSAGRPFDSFELPRSHRPVLVRHPEGPILRGSDFPKGARIQRVFNTPPDPLTGRACVQERLSLIRKNKGLV